jgi:hypothetical protein
MMIDVLADLIAEFPGRANQTRCFAHILNLIAKTVIKQFDIPKRDGCEQHSDDERSLVVLVEGIELEEIETRFKAKDGEQDEDDNDKGWVDEIELLSIEERGQLDAELRPIHVVIAKVSYSLAPRKMMLMTLDTVAQISLQDCKLIDTPPSSMEVTH